VHGTGDGSSANYTYTATMWYSTLSTMIASSVGRSYLAVLLADYKHG